MSTDGRFPRYRPADQLLARSTTHPPAAKNGPDLSDRQPLGELLPDHHHQPLIARRGGQPEHLGLPFLAALLALDDLTSLPDRKQRDEVQRETPRHTLAFIGLHPAAVGAVEAPRANLLPPAYCAPDEELWCAPLGAVLG